MITSYVWFDEYPWDVRVEKICRALVGGGHQVHITARNRDERAVSELLPEGLVHRLPWWSWAGRNVNAACQFPAFFNPRWIHLIDRTVRTSGSDVLLCRDLPLAPAALFIAKARRIPMVFDLSENYPAMTSDMWQFGRQRPLDSLVRNPAIARMLERMVVRFADHILAVVEESRSRLIALGVPAERVTVVSNTPPRSQIGPFPRTQRVSHGRLDLVYVGLLDSPVRGIDVLLTAVAKCNARGSRTRITIVGDGGERARLIALAKNLNLTSDAVRFTGRLPHDDALRALAEAHVGVVPHISTQHTDTTVANKLFDYMAAGLAVLASSAKPLARIVTETSCGEVAPSGDAGAFANAIDHLRDDGYRYRCAVAAWQAAATTYHWERDVDRLFATLESVTRRYQSRTIQDGIGAN